MIKKRIVIGVIGNDIHVVANRILARSLISSNYDVCNLGISNSVENFVFAALEFEADAVLISSLNGEAMGWSKKIRKLFNLNGMKKIKLYIGGNLDLKGTDKSKIEDKFIKLGFDRAYHQEEDLSKLFFDLSKDLN